MQGSPKHFLVVAGVDFSTGAGDAVREAVRLARRGLAGEVHVVHVVPESRGHVRRHIDEDAQKLASLPQELHQFVARHGGSQTEGEAPASVGVHVRIGDPAQELHRVAVQLDADLIVIGPHQHGLWRHRAVGGVAGKILEAAHCPVLVARPKDYSALEQMPEIEPPCPQCVETRRQTKGSKWWCDAHGGEREPVHVYSSNEEVRWAEHASDVIPTGIDFGR